MATITIERDLTIRQAGEISTLIPIFVRNSIEFNVSGADITGTYATVLIGSYEFRAVQTIFNSSLHLYAIDLTSILINIMATTALNTIEPELLTVTTTISIKLYSSTGVLVTSLNHASIQLCFGYSDINTYSEVDIYEKGSTRAIYHNGKNICFFWGGSTAVITFNVGASSDSVALNEKEYTVMDMSGMAFGTKTGTLTSTDLATFSIPIYYKPAYGDQEIAWLNRDGGWSFWNFRKVSEEIAVKKSNEVATYYPTNAATISKSRMISAEKTVKHAFDTLAYDPTHFAQLCEIQESLAVIWNDKLVRVASSNSLTAVCKQNLRFNLILEVDENIAGY